MKHMTAGINHFYNSSLTKASAMEEDPMDSMDIEEADKINNLFKLDVIALPADGAVLAASADLETTRTQ